MMDAVQFHSAASLTTFHRPTQRMYLWRRFATRKWSRENEEELWAIAGNGLAIIERRNRKRLQVEVASNHRSDLQNIAKDFGGRIEKLPRNWLRQSLRHKTKPLRVGDGTLIIPAGAAFGTGEHATTAICLRLLQKLISGWGAQAPSPVLFGASPKSSSQKSLRSRGRDRQHARRVRSPELVVDLGTGSGILALAARLLGAKRVVAIDNDPMAISTAKQNARLNKVRGVKFRVGDVREWKFEREIDVFTANLFSELLIEILPKLRTAHWFVLSGIMRGQEPELRRALRRNKIDLIEACRRGKWVAILAHRK
jgi:ribosomal protein L11 methyltransferase